MSKKTEISEGTLLELYGSPEVNPSDNQTMGEIISQRFSRRGLLKGAGAAAAIAATVSPMALLMADEARADSKSSFNFKEVEAGVDDTHHVAEGYDADVLLRWGDPLFPDSTAFDPANQTPEAQAKQFGYNNDYVGYIPIDGSSEHGLLVVNHEYTAPLLMYPKAQRESADSALQKQLADIEMAAHGGTVVEIRKVSGKWQVVKEGKRNRRITANTEMIVSGPAGGNERLRTIADPSGTKVLGMINNCSGGVTPWGTYVSGEENFGNYFKGKLPVGSKEAGNYARVGLKEKPDYSWANFYDRFDVSKEPNEANRFGWIVEIDVNDPTSKPKKRTALGRFKHEGAFATLAKDGRAVVYLGDDTQGEYVYKFVSTGKYNPDNRAANLDLLDEGTLYVARFEADGTMEWRPLVFGTGPLNATNGFNSQADVVIEARRAGDLLGATKMDRPEDIEANEVNGKVYVMLTNNKSLKSDQVNPANPRPNNKFGHIIEIAEEGKDFGATRGTWEILLKCGDPSIADVGASFSTETTKNGWFGMPDNCAVDSTGRLWVSTDGNNLEDTGRTDGIWAVETEGSARATSKLFLRVPVGAEMCGPLMLPNMETMMAAVQHPGDGDWIDDTRSNTFENPSTRWPDFKEDMPPRPSVLVITKKGGGKIAV